MTDLTPFHGEPIHCEMCGNETTEHLFGTFGVMCAACVEQTSGHSLADLSALDPATVPQRPLTAEESEAIIQATMARYGPPPRNCDADHHRGHGALRIGSRQPELTGKSEDSDER